MEPDGALMKFYLGAHAPTLSPAKIHQIHDLWLDMAHEPGLQTLHHKDVVTYALDRLEQELKGPARAELIAQIRQSLSQQEGLTSRADEPVNEVA